MITETKSTTLQITLHYTRDSKVVRKQDMVSPEETSERVSVFGIDVESNYDSEGNDLPEEIISDIEDALEFLTKSDWVE